LLLKIVILKAQPLRAEAAIEELAPTDAGLLMNKVGVDWWKLGEVGICVVQPCLEAVEEDILKMGSGGE
jgi:hypothetical protein